MVAYRRRRRAFTLVELLVVIGIIAVLIGLLLPALARARRSARTATCLSNLRQMSAAFQMYEADSKGCMPYYMWTTSDPSASAALNGDRSWFGYWIGILNNYKVRTSALLCPEANDPSVSPTTSAGLSHAPWVGLYQAAGTSVHYPGTGGEIDPGLAQPASGAYRVGSYGFNARLARDDSYNYVNLYGTWSNHWDYHVSGIQESADVPIFFDSVWFDSFLNPTTPAPYPSPPTLTGSDITYNAWRFLIDRHNYGINIAFVDGHAAFVPLTDALNHNWVPGWPKQTMHRGAGPGGLPLN